MIKNFRDKNLDIIVLDKDTDGEHRFTYQNPDGSTFVWGMHTLSCEGRYSTASEKYDLLFNVSVVKIEGINYGVISFDKDQLKSRIREQKIHWKVFATSSVDQSVRVINRGEIWLR